MDSGYIKLFRKITEWEWFDKSEMVHLFVFLLVKANHRDNEWRGISIKRGQLVTSLESIKASTSLSIQTIRSCILRLEKSGEINRQTTSKYSIITLCKYDSYNDQDVCENKKSTRKATNNQQTTNKQLTTNKNEENDKNEKNRITSVLERKQKFASTLEEFLPVYGREVLNDFYAYWTELNKSKTKFKQELETTWDTKRRLDTWVKNDFSKKRKIGAAPESKFNRQVSELEKAARTLGLDIHEQYSAG